jgi:hypothetical protein
MSCHSADRRLMSRVRYLILMLTVVSATVRVSAGPPTDITAAELRGPTVAAWRAYEQLADERFKRASASSTPYFALDQFGLHGWRETAVKNGLPTFHAKSANPGGAPPHVPDGRIHHWVGAVFVPGATVDGVVRYLQTHAGRESESFEDVLASRLLKRDGDRLAVFMKLRRTSIITVTYNTEHAVEYVRYGAARAASRSVSTRIAELADAGTPNERERAPGNDQGFLWRLNAYWRYEQHGSGVLIECESMSLSRGVPALFRPFVMGTVERIARESLERTLVSLRAALLRSLSASPTTVPPRPTAARPR